MANHLREVIANRSLRRLQVALFGSTLGDWAYATAVTVWAYQVGGAAAVGLFQTARFVVSAAAGPIGATIADRMSRQRYMVVVDAIRAGLVAVAALTVALEGRPALVVVMALLTTAVGASFRSAQAGLVPKLVNSPRELTSANALSSNIETVATFTGPALGAVLVGWAGIETACWFNVGTYLWSLVLIAGIRVGGDRRPDRPAESSSPADGTFLRELGAGFAELRRDADLRLVAVLAGAQGLLWGTLTVFTVLIAVDVLRTGAHGVGYLDSVMGLGTLAGTLTLVVLAGRGRIGRDMALGVLGWSLPMVVLAAFADPVVALGALAVIGIADAWVNLGLDTVPQRIAPDRIMSRVFSAIESVLVAAMALGSVLAPALLLVMGLRPALLVLGATVSLVVVALWGGVRRLDRRLVEPEYVDLLASVDVFAPLTRPVLEALARSLEVETYEAGDTIVSEGADGQRFYVIATGRVAVSRDGAMLRAEEAGEYFGEIALLRDVPRTASVVAESRTTVVTLGREEFLRSVVGTRDAARVAEEVVSRRLSV